MSKFNTKTVTTPPARSPIKVSANKTVTYEGASARGLDTKSELFTLAATNMVSEQTYYKSGSSRDNRYARLISEVTDIDPAWVRSLLVWLRSEANLRSASIVGAAEYVRAGGPEGRALVRAVLQRADEPGELLAYWTATYGRNVPQPIKRGIADAITGGLYNEYSIQKYDSDARGFRFADVIQLVHPKPGDAAQDALFKYALDRRYQGNDAVPAASLEMLRYSRDLDTVLRDGGLGKLTDPSAALKDAGWTWERLSSYGAFTKETWEAIIPTMGYMALLRNLRNFEQAGVREPVMRQVRDRLRDPDQVAKSRQLPFRFYSAIREVDNVKTKAALEEAFEHSFGNFDFDGRTLVLVDTSGSMQGPPSERSKITMAEIGSVFGVATALRIGGDLVAFATDSKAVDIRPGASALAEVDKVKRTSVGWGTYLGQAIRRHYDGHDRVIVFTDMQSHDNGGVDVPTYIFDLMGYGRVPDLGAKTVLFSGWNDSLLKAIPLIERGRKADWPWE